MTGASENDETNAPAARSKEELDRELAELLNEVRVGLPGVAVLFAFLLTLPFTTRFESLSWRQEGAYLTAFVSTTVALVLMITPSTFHRIRWRQDDKEAILRRSNTLTLAGFACLGIALVSCVGLMSEVVDIPAPFGILLTGGTAVLVVTLWFGLPVSRRLRGRSSDRPRAR